MTSNAQSQEIARYFGDAVASDEKLLAECLSMCQIYNLTPETLFWKWEAFGFRSTSTGSIMTPFTMDAVVSFKAHLHRELNKQTSQAKPRLTQSESASVNRGRLPQVFVHKNANLGVKAGGVQVKMESSGAANVVGPSAVKFKGPKLDESSKKKRAYRYMYEKVSERSEALDDRIDEFGELVREHYKIVDLGDPSSSTDEEVTVIGRITHDADSPASTSKIGEASLALESSRMLASGVRVPLRFDPSFKIRGGAKGAESVGVFPGAIVALKGKNGGGGWFSVTEFLALPRLTSTPISVGPNYPTAGLLPADTGFKMFIASGPYTPEADLNHKPWHALLKEINTSKPSVVLLIGPFVDSAHPKLKAGDINLTPVEFFRTQFIDPLRTFLDMSPGCTVLLIPSVRDLISSHAVFPQSELRSEVSGGDPRIRLLPNPAKFSLNDITFAASSIDVLFHLRKEEFLKRGEENDSLPASAEDTGTDAMANLCRHLLQQRSFYPIFPVPLDLSHEVNLDITHSNEMKLGEDGYAPDIMILPSRLKHFFKIVDTTIALNPSFVSKGTYSTLNVASATEGSLKNRVRVDTLKIEI